MIQGVKIKNLKPIPDERGHLMDLLRNDDEIFIKFGHVYITTTYPKVVKAWHFHKKQYDNFAVVKGMLKVVVYDSREGSPTKGEINEFFIGDHNPVLIQIPPGTYHGWKCIGTEEAIVVNISSEVYDYKNPDEYRLDPHTKDIPYNWEIKEE